MLQPEIKLSFFWMGRIFITWKSSQKNTKEREKKK